MGQTPEEIRNDIEVTRAELRDDVDRIAQRASPRGMVRRRIDQLRGAFRTLKERVMGTSPDQAEAQEARQRAQEYAASAKESVRSGAGQASEAVKSMPGRTVERTQGYPLTAGLIAFGAGLLAASVISDSQTEREAARRIKERMGGAVEPVKQSLTESAQRVGEEAQESTRQAAQQVKESAAHGGQAARDTAQREAQRAREHVQ